MKTTIELPDELFRRAKAVAALRGESLKQLITESLRKEIGGTGVHDAAAAGPHVARSLVEQIDLLALQVSNGWAGTQDAVAAVREQRRG